MVLPDCLLYSSFVGAVIYVAKQCLPSQGLKSLIQCLILRLLSPPVLQLAQFWRLTQGTG